MHPHFTPASVGVLRGALNLAILLLTLPVVIRIIREYRLLSLLNSDILSAFVLCIFCCRAINFVYAVYLWRRITSLHVRNEK